MIFAFFGDCIGIAGGLIGEFLLILSEGLKTSFHNFTSDPNCLTTKFTKAREIDRMLISWGFECACRAQQAESPDMPPRQRNFNSEKKKTPASHSLTL